jgi:hypothetical protein
MRLCGEVKLQLRLLARDQVKKKWRIGQILAALDASSQIDRTDVDIGESLSIVLSLFSSNGE